MSTQHDYSKADIKKLAKEEKIAWIRVEFVDTLGKIKKVEVPIRHLDNILNNKTLFDGSSIAGYVSIDNSDLYLHPDLSTWMVLPWTDPANRVARLICDVYTADDKPFMGDPRNVLKHEIASIKKDGYDSFDVGLEPELFLLKRDENGKPTLKTNDNISYFDISSSDRGAECRREIGKTLLSMGLPIEAAHHEVAPGQDEIDFRFSDALNTADNIELFKVVAKHVANKFGFCATFMPKPLNGVNGSGMHINMSIFKNGKNAFYDPKDKNGLSQLCYHFVGGIMKHAKAFTGVCDATVNSYKRLIPGFEAPVNIAWSLHNRTALVRVPSDRGITTRLELRSGDLTANPYMALTAVLASGLDGVEHKMPPIHNVTANLFQKSASELKAMKIDHLPGSLNEAIDYLEKDTLLDKALGHHLLTQYIALKRQEILSFKASVSKWEFEHYLDV